MPRQRASDTCTVEGCMRKHAARGFCMYHYDIERRTGRLTTGYTENRCMHSSGYVRVKVPGHPMADRRGWAFEHRVIAFDAGMLVGPGDRRHVHHRNHDKTDNRVENFEILTSSDHSRAHAKIDWNRACRLYESGWTTTRIAKEVGTHHGNVSRALRAHGVEMRASSSYRRELSPAERQQVLDLLEQGHRAKRIAKETGISVWFVQRFMREKGIPAFRPGRPEVAS